MDLRIQLDVRETALAEELALITPLTTTMVMDIGDVLITYGEQQIMIERKTVADLLSSIADGRYVEQSVRLTAHPLHNHCIYYLIEGAEPKGDVKTFYSALFSLSYYKGFSVIQSKSTKHSAYIIHNMAIKLKEDFDKKNRIGYYLGSVEKPYSDSVAKTVKKQNITPENIHEIMLSQIPGVSCLYARALLQGHSICWLVEQLKADEHCLDHITYTNVKGRDTKVSKLAIGNVKKMLLA